MLTNLGNHLQVMDLLLPSANTSSSAAASIDLLEFDSQIVVILQSGAGTGNADNTLNVNLQHSDDNITFSDIRRAAFSPVSTKEGSQKLVMNKNDIKRYLRIFCTVAGTTPSFLVSALVVGIKKYPA